MSQRRKFSAEFKAKVALEAIREESTLLELGQKYKLQPTQISAWKKEALDSMSELFRDKRKKDESQKELEAQNGDLFKKIGILTMERDWLKKKSRELGL